MTEEDNKPKQKGFLAGNCRYNSFNHAIELILDRKPEKIIEFGTMRKNSPNEGWSTITFAQLSRIFGFEFHSIEVNKDNYNWAKSTLHEMQLSEYATLHNECQFTTISSNNSSYDFLFLDAVAKDIVLTVILNHPNNFLNDSAIILIDDCLPGIQLDNIFKVINASNNLKPILPNKELDYNDEELKYLGSSKENPLNLGILEYPTQIILEYKKL